MNFRPSAALAHLLQADPAEALWAPQELAAILRHELAAPLRDELALAGAYSPEALARLCGQARPPIATLADLLAHPAPPRELLLTAKEFLKTRRHHPDHPLPVQVAEALYFALVLAARASGQAISSLPEEALEQARAWALVQAWLDERVRTVFVNAPRINARPAQHPPEPEVPR